MSSCLLASIVDEMQLSLILSYLAKPDLYHLATCNGRMLLYIAKTMRMLPCWKDLRLSPSLIYAMEQRSPLLCKALSYANIIRTSTDPVTPNIAARIGFEARNLTTMYLHVVTPDTLTSAIAPLRFPRLISLHLGGLGFANPAGIYTDTNITALLESIGKQLESFTLTKLNEVTSISFDSISLYCTSRLGELRVFSCEGLLRTVTNRNIKKFLHVCGPHLVSFDMRYSMDVTDTILQEFTNHKLNRLEVFLASRTAIYERVSHMNHSQKLRAIQSSKPTVGLTEPTWALFVKAHRHAKLLYIDDLTGEALSSTKHKFIYPSLVSVTDAKMSEDSRPIPSQIIFQSHHIAEKHIIQNKNKCLSEDCFGCTLLTAGCYKEVLAESSYDEDGCFPFASSSMGHHNTSFIKL